VAKKLYIPESEQRPVQNLLRRERSGQLDELAYRDPNLGQRTRDWHSFLNVSGESIPAWSVMRITDSNPIGDWFEYEVGKPNSQIQRHYLVNGSSDVANDARGAGTFLNNIEFVCYDETKGTPAHNEEWGPVADSWKLVKKSIGFVVVGGLNNTTGTYRTAARQRFCEPLRGRTTTALTPGGSCTVAILVWAGLDGSGKSIWADANLSGTAYDFFMNLADELPSGTKVKISWYGDVLVVDQAYCEVDDTQGGPGGGGSGGSGGSSSTNPQQANAGVLTAGGGSFHGNQVLTRIRRKRF